MLRFSAKSSRCSRALVFEGCKVISYVDIARFTLGVLCVWSRHLSAPRSVSILELYVLCSCCHVAQAYKLLRIDMPAEEVQLAAAAPPGLLDAARARWAQRGETEPEVRAAFHALQHFPCQTPGYAKCPVQSALPCHVKDHQPGDAFASSHTLCDMAFHPEGREGSIGTTNLRISPDNEQHMRGGQAIPYCLSQNSTWASGAWHTAALRGGTHAALARRGTPTAGAHLRWPVHRRHCAAWCALCIMQPCTNSVY